MWSCDGCMIKADVRRGLKLKRGFARATSQPLDPTDCLARMFVWVEIDPNDLYSVLKEARGHKMNIHKKFFIWWNYDAIKWPDLCLVIFWLFTRLYTITQWYDVGLLVLTFFKSLWDHSQQKHQSRCLERVLIKNSWFHDFLSQPWRHKRAHLWKCGPCRKARTAGWCHDDSSRLWRSLQLGGSQMPQRSDIGW